MPARTKSTLFLVLLSLIWGASYLLITVADRTMEPLTFTAGRMVIGSIILYLFIRLQGQVLPPIGHAWIPFVVLGVAGLMLPVLLIAYGEESISSGLAAVLLSTIPLMTAVLAHFILDEQLSTEKIVGVIVGLIGAFIVVLPDLTGKIEVGLWGIGLLVIVAILRAWTTVHAHHSLRDVTPVVMATGMTIVAAIVALPLTFILENPLAATPSAEGILAMVASGIFCSAVAYPLYYWLVAKRGATYASLVSATRPAVAIVLSAIFVGAAIQMTTVVGTAILVLCIVIMNGYLGKAIAAVQRLKTQRFEIDAPN